MEGKKIFQIPTIIDKVTTMKDGSAKIILVTPELNKTEETAKLFSMVNLQVWTAMCITAIKESDIKIDEVKVEEGQRTPSQRLLGIKYWEAKNIRNILY